MLNTLIVIPQAYLILVLHNTAGLAERPWGS